MATDALAVVRACLKAYVDKDRNAIEALIAGDYHFTSPLDNAPGSSTGVYEKTNVCGSTRSFGSDGVSATMSPSASANRLSIATTGDEGIAQITAAVKMARKPTRMVAPLG